MVKVLDQFTPSRPRYPWKRWTDGKPRSAKRGVDFGCSVMGFRSVLYTFAHRANIGVRVSVKPDEVVEFQFSKSRK